MEPYRARIPERLGLSPILASWDGGSHRLPGDVVRFERAQQDDNSLFTDTDRGDKGLMPSTNLMKNGNYHDVLIVMNNEETNIQSFHSRSPMEVAAKILRLGPRCFERERENPLLAYKVLYLSTARFPIQC